MCKCINPLCCIPSGMGCVIVAILDILLGGLTLLLSANAIYHFKDARTFLETQKMSDDVAWFGILSIPFVGFIGLWSGFKLFVSLIQSIKGTQESNHMLKFVVFFLAEVVGFIAPFFIFGNYLLKIKTLTTWSDSFIVFHLLEVNPITMSIFVYQILSFWVVHRHELLQKEAANNARKKTTKPRRSLHAAPPKTPINAIELRLLGSGSKTNSNRHGGTIVPVNPVYPDLNALMLGLLPSPAYPKPQHAVLDMDSEAYDSDASLTDELTVFEKRNGLQSGGPRSQFQLKKQKLVQNGVLFEDQDFPANNASLGSGRGFVWKRPHEINKSARFFKDGFSRFDVRQGSLGDCWFLAALANLTLNDNLFTQVVPHDNEWTDGGMYCGMCHFRFWVNGKWEEVTIDDRLPTKDGKLVYLYSSEESEFWSALVEKAYAKLNGSYMNLSGNDGIGRAMTNLTAGSVTRYELNSYLNELDELFDLMNTALKNGKMLGCCTRNDLDGIVGNHAYSITHVKRIQLTTGRKVSCIRIRNPWGNEKEWTGVFGDGHEIWNLVNKKIRKELQVIFKSDGEFWFPLKELAGHFDMVEICHLP